MERKGGLLLVFVVLAFSAATTSATIVTIGLTAEITYSEWDNYKVGDVITGRYTYNTDTPDLNPSPTIGHYQHSSPPYGVNLSVNGFIFQTDPDHVDFLVGTLNDENGRDSYGFISYNNQSLPNNIPVWHIALQLDDYSGTALYSDALPTEPPVVGDWESIFGLMITFGYKGGAGIRAEVTSFEYVPEPTVLLLLCLGGIVILPKRRT